MTDQALLLDLTRRYSEPHRHYHTLDHIAYLFTMGRDLQLSDEQALAIWFHDAIFDVTSTTNEADSAELAERMLQERNYAADKIAIVKQIVLDTQRHVPTIEESALVMDLDLCPLAAPVELFESNGEKLRLENQRLSDEEYDRGLRGFLETFLAKDQIFWTPWGQPMEAIARGNLERTLDSLAAGK